jgi:cobalt-zinc-cadmium efflux system membrane fusion protein
MNQEAKFRTEPGDFRETQFQRKRRIEYGVGAIALLVVLACTSLLSGCKKEAANAPEGQTDQSKKDGTGAKQNEVTEVVLPLQQQQGVIETVKVVTQEEPEMQQFSGRIVLPDNESWRVGTLTNGRIEQVYANLGEYVHKGDVLARMHSHDVHEARAAYAMALADRSRLESAAALAQINFDRMQRLYALRAASVEQTEQAKQDLINAKTALNNGQTEVTRSKAHLEENLGVRADVPPNASGTADLIPIIAPASGYVLQKNVTPGTTVAPATDLFVLGDTRHLWMLASIGQEFLTRIKVGQKAWVTLPGVTGQRFSGSITNLGQQFDPTTRRLQVRIDLTQSSAILRPEMLATAEIAVGEVRPLMLIAPEAVQQVNGQDVVFVRTGADRFVPRPVHTGGSVNDKVELKDGVHPGDEVVTRGSFLLKSQLMKASMQGES